MFSYGDGSEVLSKSYPVQPEFVGSVEDWMGLNIDERKTRFKRITCTFEYEGQEDSSSRNSE